MNICSVKKSFIALMVVFLSALSSLAQSNECAYLFAHMTNEDYGSLFYSVSTDGKHWRKLNGGRRIIPSYSGHPNIEKDDNGIYYMIGVTYKDGYIPILFTTTDLIHWKEKELSASIFDTTNLGYELDTHFYGAPKIFYDADSKQFMITWHHNEINKTDQEAWESEREFYTLTSDWEHFTSPQKLFNFTGEDQDMATIDAIICKEGAKYYAIVKDERWPDKWKYGKTIRVASSDNLTGPYSNPSLPVTDSWREAPTIVRSPDDSSWYLYTENYPIRYCAYELGTLENVQKGRELAIIPPEGGRHGCVIKISMAQYDQLINHFITPDNPINYTWKIQNAQFDEEGGWEGSPTVSESCGEKCNCNFDVYQTLTDLPNGWYKLSCQGFYRQGDFLDAADYCMQDKEALYAILYANDKSIPLTSILSEASTKQWHEGWEFVHDKYTAYGYVPNSMAGTKKRFEQGQYDDNVIYVKVTDSTLRIGIRKTVACLYDWTIFDNFKLEFIGQTPMPNTRRILKGDVTGEGVINISDVAKQVDMLLGK